MSQILVYSRATNPEFNNSIEILCKKLTELGHHTELTHSTQVLRLILNNHYQIIHLFIEKLPLNMNEKILLSFANTIGKSTVLSVFNSEQVHNKPFYSFLKPDALTLSQTKHFQYFRDWSSHKSILPLFPDLKHKALKRIEIDSKFSYFVPLEKKIDEAFKFNTSSEIFFDARKLLKTNSSTELRKKWTQFIAKNKSKANFHLILSDEKIAELLAEKKLHIILANPELSHTDFTFWLAKTLNQEHLIWLNEHQATGFSESWTSEENCIVLSGHDWPKPFNHYQLSHENLNRAIRSHFSLSNMTQALVNDLSRLYTKIIHQKATLISAGSAKIKT